MITPAPMSAALFARVNIAVSGGMLSIEVVGGSGGEVWRVERSSDLLTWESLGTVELEANGGLGSRVLSDVPLGGGSSFFRAVG